MSDPAARTDRARTARARREPVHGPARRPLAARDGFDLVTAVLDDDAARAEASRCLQCQLVCDRCVEVCPNRANASFRISPVEREAPRLDATHGTVLTPEIVRFRQERQIVHVVDLCNECGNCATFCAHEGRPFADKPRLFLDAAAFAADSGPALTFSGGALRGKDAHGGLWTLTPDGEDLRYVDAAIEVVVSPELEARALRAIAPSAGAVSAARAIEAAVLFRGLCSSAVWALIEREKGDAR